MPLVKISKMSSMVPVTDIFMHKELIYKLHIKLLLASDRVCKVLGQNYMNL